MWRWLKDRGALPISFKCPSCYSPPLSRGVVVALARFLPCSAGGLLQSFSNGSPEATLQHFVFVSGKPVTACGPILLVPSSSSEAGCESILALT